MDKQKGINEMMGLLEYSNNLDNSEIVKANLDKPWVPAFNNNSNVYQNTFKSFE